MIKYSLVLLFTGILLTACLNPQQTQENACGVKWQLVEMTGNIANVPPLKGDAMSWQESYIFNPDSTFSKERLRNQQVIATGSYKFFNIGGNEMLELTYDAPSEIIGSCTAGNKETLRLLDGKLYSTWYACDGPGLTYERMTVNCED